MSKNDQIRRLIEAIVKKELKTILPEIVPHVIKEVMAGMIMESAVSPQATTFLHNSEKRRKLTESRRSYDEDDLLDEDELDAYQPPRRPSSDRQRPRPAVEWEGGNGPALRNEGLNVPTKAATESGNLVSIDPNNVPDFIIKAMNTNYSDFMKKVKDKSNG